VARPRSSSPHLVVLRLRLLVERDPTQRQELGAQLALLLLEHLVLLGHGGLALQMLKPFGELLTQILETL